MENSTTKVNDDLQWQVLKVGNEGTPVVIIDNFYSDTGDIIYQACHHSTFESKSNSYYPGIRSPLPRSYVISALQAIYQRVCAIYDVPLHLQLKPQETYFSLITTPENELSLIQRMPHFDTSRQFYFAALHYLNDGEHGNTGLFRHKPTNLEKINCSDENAYIKSAQHHIDTQGEPKLGYFTESDEQFELFKELEYKPNRLVIYPGQLLHSILIRPKNDIDSNPKTGRLTANIFFEFQ